MSSKDKSKDSKIRRYRLPITVTIVSVTLSVFAGLYGMGEKCQNDIDSINHVINSAGGIDTDNKIFQQLRLDGCADLSKSTKDFITSEIQP